MDLPDGVLKLVLQHVLVKDRLGSCCLVSRRMHAAAVAATETLSFQGPPQHAASASVWLSSCGQQLTKLYFGVWGPPRELVCPYLLELELFGCHVQLGAADGHAGITQSCTKLTRLVLYGQVTDMPQGGIVDCGLSRLVHLQYLDLVPTNYGATRCVGLSAFVLPCLQHLTFLKVIHLSIENVAQLVGLTSLQELHLSARQEGILSEEPAVGLSSIPGLVLPASLTKLVLSSPVEAGILSAAPAGLQDLQVGCTVEGPPAGPDSFLSCMARLQSLTRLSIEPVSLALPPPGPAYSALTASSSLVQLDLSDIELPTGVWSYVFPASCKLLHLTSLLFGAWHDNIDDAIVSHPRWSAANLVSLVSRCPSLRCAENLFLQPGLHVSELHKLTALTRVGLYYSSDSEDSCSEFIKGLAVISQLHSLDMETQRPQLFQVPMASLLPLTSLTTLTHFQSSWGTMNPTVSLHTTGGYLPQVSTQFRALLW